MAVANNQVYFITKLKFCYFLRHISSHAVKLLARLKVIRYLLTTGHRQFPIFGNNSYTYVVVIHEFINSYLNIPLNRNVNSPARIRTEVTGARVRCA